MVGQKIGLPVRGVHCDGSAQSVRVRNCSLVAASLAAMSDSLPRFRFRCGPAAGELLSEAPERQPRPPRSVRRQADPRSESSALAWPMRSRGPFPGARNACLAAKGHLVAGEPKPDIHSERNVPPSGRQPFPVSACA